MAKNDKLRKPVSSGGSSPQTPRAGKNSGSNASSASGSASGSASAAGKSANTGGHKSGVTGNTTTKSATTTKTTKTVVTTYEREPIKWGAPLLAAGIGLPLLMVWGMWPVRHAVEKKLTQKATAQIATKDLPDAKVKFTGRDAKITGTVDSPGALIRLHDAVRERTGVRHVDISGVGYKAANPEDSTKAGPTLGFAINTSTKKVTLTGVVSDQATKDALLAQATTVFGEGNVTDQMSLGLAPPTATATIAKFGSLLKQVAAPKGNVSIGWADGKIVLQGIVASAADKTAAGASAAAIVGADNVANQLTIGSAAAETTVVPETTTAPATTKAPTTTPATETTVATETTIASEPVTTVDAAVAAPTADITAILKVNNIEFETGSAVLTPAGRATVAKVAEVLKKYPEVKVAIEGHTDNVGNDGSNLTLSKARAATTKRTLEGDGVSADRMTADGFGETRPIADNATADGRARNRRTEFRLSQ